MSKNLFLILLLHLPILLIAQNDWKKKYDKNGILGFIRDVDGSKFVELKMTKTMKGSVKSAYDLLRDVDAFPTFFANTEHAEIVHEFSKDDVIIYIKTNTPFPARDRDGTYRNVFSYDDEKNEASVKITCDVDHYPHTTSNVQITECYGSWYVKPASNGMIEVTHQMYLHPGGSPPAFIVNGQALKSPAKAMKNMEHLIQTEKYATRG